MPVELRNSKTSASAMAPGTPPPVAPGDICSGFNSMNHGGFIVGPSTVVCQGLLINGWPLHTNTTYGFAVFGTFATAVIVELFTWVRREKLRPRKGDLREAGYFVAAFFINLFQIATVYTLMLLVMLNDLWFLLAIVLGLSIGHTAFNFGKA